MREVEKDGIEPGWRSCPSTDGAAPSVYSAAPETRSVPRGNVYALLRALAPPFPFYIFPSLNLDTSGACGPQRAGAKAGEEPSPRKNVIAIRSPHRHSAGSLVHGAADD